MLNSLRVLCGATAALLCLLINAHALTMPSIFSDHMVLQQQAPAPVWGKADARAQVEVYFAGQSLTTTADDAGHWRVDLAPLASNAEGAELVVSSGGETLTFADVLVGEVWVCSGQSNMEWGISLSYGGKEAIEAGNHPGIRLLQIDRAASLTLVDDAGASWKECTPENLKEGRLNGFSAVGYLFALEVHRKRGVPVGIIQSAWGGTSVAPWIPESAYRADEQFAREVQTIEKRLTTLDADRQHYQAVELPAWETRHAAWKESIEQWKLAIDAAKQSGAERPPKPKEPKRPSGPETQKQATALFNAMIHPLIPYGIRGAIWYQGESNSSNARLAKGYEPLFQALITGWRAEWGQGDFPFLYVQLPEFSRGGNWPITRASQAAALHLPNTGMAVTLDLNQEDNLHPRAKKEVAERLALLAESVAYGQAIVATGPVAETAQVNAGSVTVRFTSVNGDLQIGQPPASAFKDQLQPPLADQLNAFELAGADGEFHAARAEIAGATVVVTSADVPDPQLVRYAWSAAPQANLYDGLGLPAAPFELTVE